MKTFFNILLFLALTAFCVYFFNGEEKKLSDLKDLPDFSEALSGGLNIGFAWEKIIDNYQDLKPYLQGASDSDLWQFWLQKLENWQFYEKIKALWSGGQTIELPLEEIPAF